jgi:hypothetical protein
MYKLALISTLICAIYAAHSNHTKIFSHFDRLILLLEQDDLILKSMLQTGANNSVEIVCFLFFVLFVIFALGIKID